VTQDISQQFGDEIRSFFAVTILNLVFGALVLAFGVLFIVSSLVPLGQSGTFGLVPLLQLLVGVIGALLGIRWITLSATILKGVGPVQKEYRRMKKPLDNEVLTGMIIRLVSHYRGNQSTIQKMIFLCALGGCVYVALGLVNIIQSVFMGTPLPVIFGVFAAGGNIVIGLVALRSSVWFRRYTTAWDQRLELAIRSEDTLRQAMDRV
jgi:hypothetical protein